MGAGFGGWPPGGWRFGTAQAAEVAEIERSHQLQAAHAARNMLELAGVAGGAPPPIMSVQQRLTATATRMRARLGLRCWGGVDVPIGPHLDVRVNNLPYGRYKTLLLITSPSTHTLHVAILLTPPSPG